MKKNIFNQNLPSFCTSNFEVIKSIMMFSKCFGLPVLLECTSNQVNQQGGYTKLKPKDFYKKVISFSKKIKLNRNKIIFGADHLGPLPWKNLNNKKALKNSQILLKSVLIEDFKKIHLDTTIICRNDKNFDLDTVRKRFFKLFKSIPKKKLKKIYFVVGSEVPFAGGGTSTLKTSTLKNVKNDHAIYNTTINKNVKKPSEFALVIEPGMSFSNNKITKPNFKNLKKISKFSKDKKFVFEAHSTDYQKIDVLKKLVKANFKFLKVGPELTFRYHESIKFMLKLEKMFTPIKKRSHLNSILTRTMKMNPKYWKNYYKGNANKVKFLQFNSLLDRIRYYWNFKLVNKSKKKLFSNINKMTENKVLKLLKADKNVLKIYKKYKISNSELIIIKFLNYTIAKYYKACGFRLLD